MGRAKPDVRPPVAAIPSAVGLQRSGDWPAARRSDQCAAAGQSPLRCRPTDCHCCEINFDYLN